MVHPFSAAAALLLATGPAPAADAAPSPASDDRAAIGRVLSDYAAAVSSGDEALFLSLLLDEDIPFLGVDDAAAPDAALTSARTRAFADFRRGIFHSGRHYAQTFDHVAIEQHAALASASLHFVTRTVGRDDAGQGWKTLALIKVGGRWKIASEFYTVGDLPRRGAAAGARR